LETPGIAVGRRRPDRRGGAAVLHQRNGRAALSHAPRGVLMDMWAPYAKLVREHATNAQIRSTDSTSSSTSTRRSRKSGQRNASSDVKESGVQAQPLVAAEESLRNLTATRRKAFRPWCGGNTPIVRAYYLKNLSSFWDYRQPGRANSHLKKWMRSAGLRLAIQEFCANAAGPSDGILP